MPTDQPILSVAWTTLGRFTMSWTHSGDDIFAWYISVTKTATGANFFTQQTFATTLREKLIPPFTSSSVLEDDTSYSCQVMAMSLSGHVQSHICTIANGHQVSHTFFDDTIQDIWAEHDSGVVDFGSGNTRYLPSMDFTHISDYGPLPSDFLPADAIPLAVTGGIEFGCFAIETENTATYDPGIDHRIFTHPQLYGRPDGYEPPWTVSPTYPGTGAVTGLHASSEWLGSPSFVEAYKTIDPIQTEFNGQSDYPTRIDPHTGLNWVREDILDYKWGWGWYTWSSYISIADQTGTFLNPDPPPTLITRPVREVAGDGRIKMFKVYVDYAFPAVCGEDGGGNGNGGSEPDPATFGGIYYINPTKATRHDSYYGDTEKKIPDPTIRTAFIGD